MGRKKAAAAVAVETQGQLEVSMGELVEAPVVQAQSEVIRQRSGKWRVTRSCKVNYIGGVCQPLAIGTLLDEAVVGRAHIDWLLSELVPLVEV